MPEFDQDALDASLDVIGRVGAKQFEIGYVHEGVPIEKSGWYAHVQYHGTRVTAQDHCGPVEAAEALARRLLDDGTCAYCGLKVSLGDYPGKRCRWTRDGKRWFRGCEATHSERDPRVVAAAKRALRGDLDG